MGLVLIASFLLVASFAPLCAQVPDPPGELPERPGGGFGGFGGVARSRPPRPYKDVITSKAVTQKGVFSVHRIDDQLFFEIPKDQLGKEFLWVTEAAKTPRGGYGGTAAGDRVVRWTRRGNRILLRGVNYGIRAEKTDSIQIAVEAANFEPIIMALDIAAFGEGESAVVDVTRLFTSDPPEFSVRRRLGVGSVDGNRSFIERAMAFPTNLEVESLLTFGQAQAAGGAGAGPPSPFGPRGSGEPSNSALVHYSIVRLPDQPMMGRLFDSRVGFFSESFTDYGTEEHRAKERQFITRYRLEKKDPAAAVSEPIKPIVYYVSREVPDKWKPYVKKGIEDWQPAFEQAGFKNAIIGKYAPSEKEDPNWSPEDARYSVVRWAASTTENAMGPNVHDPRSGEIISAHVIMWHNILNLQTRWYFTQASPSDSRAQKLPIPDALMGELVRFVVAHEVGHTLGLQHNMKASSSYSVAQLRNPEFTKACGTAPSIMDYARFNYVAQPGDGAHLIPMVGPYDKFAIEWGYMPMPTAKNPADEKEQLDRIAARQVTNPMLRFGGNPNEDPTQQTEDLGGDAVEATRLGLKNLERVMGFLFQAATKFGEDYDDLTERYDDVWGQRNREINHVVATIGGVEMIDWHVGRGRDTFIPIPCDRQKRAVAFLNEAAFKTPYAMLPTRILNQIQPSGAVSRVLSSQQGVLNRLLSDSRLSRMLELEQIHKDKAYRPGTMLADLREGIWSELNMTRPKVEIYRRNLQRAHVLNLTGKLDNKNSAVRALALAELRTIASLARKKQKLAADRLTSAHLDDVSHLIELALKPAVTMTAASSAETLPEFPRRRPSQDYGCFMFAEEAR